ncbi:hypothetical protein HZS_1674 [Henneguya salminicola]|nr:hypothetical protein HZS_1674 [Henneguya salminicola]
MARESKSLDTSVLDDIFHDLQETTKILLDNEILQDSRICEKCGNSSSLKMGGNETLLYRCQKAGCQARSIITSSKLEMKKASHAIYYLLLLDVDYKQLFLAYKLSSYYLHAKKASFHWWIECYSGSR